MEIFGHLGSSGARFDGDDFDSMAGNPVADGLHIGGYGGFGGVVDGLARTTSVAGDASDGDDGAVFGVFHAFGGLVDPGDGAENVDVDHGLVFFEVVLVKSDFGHDAAGRRRRGRVRRGFG